MALKGGLVLARRAFLCFLRTHHNKFEIVLTTWKGSKMLYKLADTNILSFTLELLAVHHTHALRDHWLLAQIRPD